MSVSVHLLCAFSVVGDHGELVKLAETHKGLLEGLPDDVGAGDAISMLEYIASGNGRAEGRNGAMITWGHVGNYACGESFFEALIPFFADCWNDRLILRSDHVVVLEQGEDRPNIMAIEVRLSDLARDAVMMKDVVAVRRDIGVPVFRDFEGIHPDSRVHFDTSPADVESRK